MSTSGTYAYWPKVEHQNAIFPQMASASLQPPFYFGGSQVPVNLAEIIITPNPVDVDSANVANGNYTYQVSIGELGLEPSVVIAGANNQIVYAPPTPWPFPDTIDIDLMG